MKSKTKNKRNTKHTKRKNPQNSLVYNYGSLLGLIHQLKVFSGIKEPTNIKTTLPSKEKFENEFKDFMEGFIKGMEEAKTQYKLIPKSRIKIYIKDLIDESKLLEFQIKQFEQSFGGNSSSPRRNPLPNRTFEQSLNIINFFPTTNEYGRYFYTRLYDRWVKFAKLQYNININETTTTVESMIEAIKKDRSLILAVKEYRDGDVFKISPSLIKEFQTLIDKLEQYPKNMMIIIPRP